MEERRNVTYGLWGEELPQWMAIQRLVLAGFHDPRVLLNMFADHRRRERQLSARLACKREADAGA
jgi:hypothetical protein